MRLAVFFLLNVLFFVSANETYEGYKVFRVWPKTEEQRNTLMRLEASKNLDFWTDVGKVNSPVDIMVTPQLQETFIRDMMKIGPDVSIFIEDVAGLIKDQTVDKLSRNGMTWNVYYDLGDIHAWLEELATKYPDKVIVEIGGSSYEDRQIKGVKISFGSGRKAVVIEGGIHANEWISPATLTYIINELLTSTDSDFRTVAESFDWYIFPVINPDGYAYTHTSSRLWRKTRTPYSDSCWGADPNRNWDAHWGEKGTDNDCTSSRYSGPKPFSEKCMQSFAEYIKTVAPDMVAYISFHSYSQLLMVPYGHTTDPLDNYNETVAIGKKAVEALAKRYGTEYVVGNTAETIYEASGVSVDWVKQEFQTPLVYTYELRDNGLYGFLLPASQIIANCEEVIDSLVAMFQEADKMGIVSLI